MKKVVLLFGVIILAAVLMTGCGTKTGASQSAGQDSGMTARQQEDTARKALEDYFKISADFSKGSYDSDAVFKKELKARYQQVTTGALLAKLNKFVDDGNIQSDYYLSVFMTEADSQVKEVKVLKSSADTIEAQAVVNNNYEFSSMTDDLESADFVKDNKVAGVTQEKFTELVRTYNPIAITSAQVKHYSFKLVKEGQAWKLSRLGGEVNETKLLELQSWDGKKISL